MLAHNVLANHLQECNQLIIVGGPIGLSGKLIQFHTVPSTLVIKCTSTKTILFGVTHVCAIDGYSGMIVGFATFPIKNNVLIYEHLYRLVLYCSSICWCII